MRCSTLANTKAGTWQKSCHKDPGYYTWVLGSDFTYNTKQVLTRIRLREFNKRIKSCSQLPLDELFFKELRESLPAKVQPQMSKSEK